MTVGRKVDRVGDIVVVVGWIKRSRIDGFGAVGVGVHNGTRNNHESLSVGS